MVAELTMMVFSAILGEIARRITNRTGIAIEFERKKKLFKAKELRDLYIKTKLRLHHNFIGICSVLYSFVSGNVDAFWFGTGLLLHHFFTEGW